MANVQRAKGSIFRRDGKPVGVRVSMPDGSRPLVPFKPDVLAEVHALTAEQLDELAQAVSDEHRGAACVSKGTPETVNEYVKRWCEWRDKHVSSAPENRRQLKRFCDMLGTLEIAKVTADHLKPLVKSLDAEVAAKKRSGKTAINDWATIKAMFRDASGGTKEESLIVPGLKNPTEGVMPPDAGDDKDRLYLYPADALELFWCEDVPLVWRRIYALAIYTAMRAGELHVLSWADVDFVAGQIRVNKAEDRYRHAGKTKSTKTRKPRRVPIERELLPLLQAMHKEADGKGRVFPAGIANRAAEYLHRHLRWSGVAKRRPELVTASETIDNLSFHDLRGTAATWWLLRGDSPRNVKKRTGHAGYAMLERYDHESDDRNIGQLFPPLTVLLKPSPPTGTRAGTYQQKRSNFPRKPVGAAGFESDEKRREVPSKALDSGSGPDATGTLGSLHDVPDPAPSELTDEDLERGILKAMLDDRGEVASELTRQLRARRAALARAKVVPIDVRRLKG